MADNYKNEIRKYFFGLFDYISKKGEKVLNIKKNKKSSKLMLNENSNKINMSIVASFVNETFQNYQNETRNYILSKIRKYVRLLNNNFTQNFDFKITFKKNNKENTVLTYYELEYITSSFKKKNDIENLTIFYFLYYSGLNFTSISRILLRNFKNGFQTVYIKKGSLKKVSIPIVIQNCLIKLFYEKNNNCNYFFYESFSGNDKITRIEYIKKKFSSVLNSFKEIPKK